MAIFNHQSSTGYKYLRTYQQALEIQNGVKDLAAALPHFHPATRQPMTRTIDQITSCGRSVPRNIVEGFKRSSTGEYIKFLGYSLGSLEELVEDMVELEGDVVKTNGVGWNRVKLSDVQSLIRSCHGEDKMLRSQVASLERSRSRDGYKTPQEAMRAHRKHTRSGSQFIREEAADIMRKQGLVETEIGFMTKEEAVQKNATIIFDPGEA